MALTDFHLLFADAQQFDVATATPETAPNTVDLAAMGTTGVVVAGAGQSRDWGPGEHLFGHILVTTAFAAPSTDGTIQIKFQSTATEPAGGGAAFSTPTTHWDSGLITEATLVKGHHITFNIPQAVIGSPYLRWIGFLVTAATQNFSAGNLTIWIDRNGGGNTSYASGHNWA